jgi:integrase/recombinase XerD
VAHDPIRGLSVSEAGKLLDRFRLYLVDKRGRSRLTAEGYASDLRQWLNFCEAGDLAPFPPSPAAVSAFLRHMDGQGKQRSTQQRRIAAMRSWIRFVETEEAEESDSPLPEPPGATKPTPRVLNEAEIRRLMEACGISGPLAVRDRAIFEIAYGCGLKVSEICALEVPDLDFESKLLRTRGRGEKERVVPFLGETARGVKAYMDARPMLDRDGTNRVFLSCSGRPLSRQDIWRIMKKRGRAAGITESRLYPHILRHSFAMHLLARGVDMRTLQEMLGHSSVMMTQTYSCFDEKMRDFYDRFHPRA